MSLKSRIFISASAVFFVGFIALIGVTSYMMQESGRQAGEKYLVETTQMLATQASKTMAEAQLAARTAADAMEGLHAAGITDRTAYGAVMKQVIAANAKFAGGGSVLEPDVAGKDADNKDVGFSDANGRFIPYFYLDGAKVAFEPLLFGGDSGSEEWYDKPKKLRQDTVTEPYLYPVNGVDVLMATASSPAIASNSKAIGGATIDVTLDGLQDQINAEKHFETGFVGILSENGVWVSHPNKELLGKPAASEILAKLNKAGTSVTFFELDGLLEAVRPFQLSNTNQHWFVVLGIEENELLASAITTRNTGLTLAFFMLLAGTALMWLLGGNIAKPVAALTDRMRQLADGDIDSEILHADRKDEIGQMARTLNIFIQNETQRRSLESSSNDSQQTQIERQKQVDALIVEFEDEVRVALEAVSTNTGKMEDTANSLDTIARETSGKVSSVATSSDTTQHSVQTVASAAEELSASISEIGRQIDQTKDVVSTATKAAATSNERVESLDTAAQKIGEVVSLIQAIAEQTNLLALNATIEAARAGDAGRGFAVVASEVKELATQTAKATEDISAQITGIQSSTRDAVGSIQEIASTMEEVNRFTVTIADAISQQGDATAEISHNVQQAANCSQDMSSNVGAVMDASEQTSQSAGDVLSVSQDVSTQAHGLQDTIANFLSRVRAA
ncbi:MAG: methyl-accepting chemotaxis protein [Roseibium sp.]